jgi:hypothetical protein
MSKLVSQIKATDTGRRHAKKEPLSKVLSVKDSVEMDVVYQHGIEYRIEVKLGARAVIPHDQPEKLDFAIDATKRSIIEHIFGEFRPYFRELEMALWEYDTETATKILKRFERQMFEEDSFE